MDFDAIRDVWTAESGGEMTMAEEAMIQGVLKQDRTLARKVRVRDFIELAVSLAMAAGLLVAAVWSPTRWPWVLAAIVTLTVGAVFVRERSRRPRPGSDAGSLRAGLRAALAEADHQIRLLRSVAWWYLLPLAGVVVLIIVGVMLNLAAELSPEQWAGARRAMPGMIVGGAAAIAPVYWIVWWANQRAVRQHLLPHRERIAAALQQLDANGATEDA